MKIEVKSHADFKRVLQGKNVLLETLTLVNNAVGNRLKVGDIRYINIANSVGVYLKFEEDTSNTRGSFLDYGKATEWIFNEDVVANKLYGYSYRLINKEERWKLK